MRQILLIFALISYGVCTSQTYFTEDFLSGISSNWTNSSTPWEYRGPSTTPSNQTGSIGCYSSFNPIYSNTWFNGFIIFDSDYYDNGGGCQLGAGPYPAPHIGELISPSIDISGSSLLQLKFYTEFQSLGSKAFIKFYNDANGNLIDSMELQSPTYQSYVELDVPQTVVNFFNTNTGNLKIGFCFDAISPAVINGGIYGYYYWMIDDIELSEAPAHEITLIDEKTPVYTIIPKFQTDSTPIYYGLEIVSTGTQSVSNVTANFNILVSSVISSFNSNSLSSLASGDTATLYSNTPFQPQSTGTYGIGFSASSNEVSSSNNLYRTIEISDTVYAMDNNGSSGNPLGVATNCGGQQLMNLFEIANGTSINSISTHISYNSVIGTPIYASIYFLDTVSGNFNLIHRSSDYFIDSNDIENWKLINLDSSIVIGSGIYGAAVGGYQDSYNVFSVNVSGLATSAYCLIQDNGCGLGNQGNGYWYVLNEVPMIRLNMVPQGVVYGCTDSSSINYDPNANQDDGSCIYNVTFVVDANNELLNNGFSNYYIEILGSMYLDTFAMTDSNSDNIWNLTLPLQQGITNYRFYNDTSTESIFCLSSFYREADILSDTILNIVCYQSCLPCNILGCTDPQANNYDSNATLDNNSCVYLSNSCIVENYNIQSYTVVGQTTYGLQSNRSTQNRIVVDENSFVSIAWTFSNEFTSSFSDRGSGYYYIDSLNYGPMPSSRIESSRSGWPTILQTGSGREIIISHSTDNGNINIVSRDSLGHGNWQEQTVPSTLNSLSNTSIYWNRASVGGVNNNTIHMIALTFGAPVNGMQRTLLYFRSSDAGVSWDIQDMALPTVDTTNLFSVFADSYSIDSRDSIVVIAVFNDFNDSFVLKSSDNGVTWTRKTFIDFPIEKYDWSGIDFNNDGYPDEFYSTDKSGHVIIDNNNIAHVFFGNMRYNDDADGTNFGSYKRTNGLMYWNETMGEDILDSNINLIDNHLWKSNMPIMIAESMDLNGDNQVFGDDFILDNTSIYGTSLSSMPTASVDNDNNLYLTYSSYVENIYNGNQNYRHLYMIKSSDNGLSWSCPVDITLGDSLSGQIENVYPSLNKRTKDNYLHITYQRDFEPGLSVWGDGDIIDVNEIIYDKIDTSNLAFVSPGIFGCTDPISLNYDSLAVNDDGSCLICDLTYNPVVQQNTTGLCDGFILVLSTSSNQPINYQWGNGSTTNNITNLCDGIYNITVTDSIGCVISDTIVIGTISGCTDSTAINYNPLANFDDSSCFYCDLNININIIQNTSGLCNGAAIITNVNTSFPPHSYQWSTGSSYNNITQLCDGIYTVSVSDSLGCIVTDTFYIGPNSASGCDTVYENATACNSYLWNGNTYTQSGTYNWTSQNILGCDSVVILNLIINYSTTSTQNVVSCDSYTWNGTIYDTSGTYYDTTTTVNGCDSIMVLSLTINDSTSNTTNLTACDSYTWNGMTYTTSGMYTWTGTTVNGCDSIEHLNLTINYSTSSVHTNTSCDSYTWPLNGLTYTNSGLYTNTSINSSGCTHTDTLLLTINNSDTVYENATACDSYLWNGNTYTQSGTYNWTSQNVLGCDSVVILSLIINYSTTSTQNVVSCDSYTLNGTIYDTSGTYYDTTTTVNGCDSIMVLSLTINDSTSNTTNLTACDSYTWNGMTYTTSGMYTWTGTTVNGCDSIEHLNLTINYTSSSTITLTVCDSLVWNGSTYDVSGNYSYVTQNSQGCDSTAYLNLTVVYGTDVYDTVTICDGETYTVANSTYNTTGVYVDTVITSNGCISTITTNLTVSNPLVATVIKQGLDLVSQVNGGTQPYTYLWNTFSNSSSITPDSNGYYWLIVTDANSCVSDTAYYFVNFLPTDVGDITIDDLVIYPNPSKDIFNISFNSENIQDIEIRVVNMTGENVFLQKLDQFVGKHTTQVDLSKYSKAAYFLEINTTEGTINKKLILQ